MAGQFYPDDPQQHMKVRKKNVSSPNLLPILRTRLSKLVMHPQPAHANVHWVDCSNPDFGCFMSGGHVSGPCVFHFDVV